MRPVPDEILGLLGRGVDLVLNLVLVNASLVCLAQNTYAGMNNCSAPYEKRRRAVTLV